MYYNNLRTELQCRESKGQYPVCRLVLVEWGHLTHYRAQTGIQAERKGSFFCSGALDGAPLPCME